jgi:hypothetical protein
MLMQSINVSGIDNVLAAMSVVCTTEQYTGGSLFVRWRVINK